MAYNERGGRRKTRKEFSKCGIPKLGYYFIVTDAKETERNYMYGLRDSIPKELQGKLVIKVIKAKTRNLVDEAMNLASLNPQYGEPWIVFDRDKVSNFDEIIKRAQEKAINVGWTNPCIETWLSAYFGKIPTWQDSVTCCEGFSRLYKDMTNQEYSKSDAQIYEKLNRFGNEEKAIKLAYDKQKEHAHSGKDKPSEMCPCTTVHMLVDEIKSKITEENNYGNRKR